MPDLANRKNDPELDAIFQDLVTSPEFQAMTDEDRAELYASFGRKYVDPVKTASKWAGQDVMRREKTWEPQAVSDLSSAAGGALSGFRAGRLPGAAVGALLGVAGNRLMPKAIEKASFGRVPEAEPEGASWSNILSLNPVGKGALVNAAMRAGESGAGALLDNLSKARSIKNHPELANSPLNEKSNWLLAAATGGALGAAPGVIADVAGAQYARRLGKEQEIQQALEGVKGTSFDPTVAAAELGETRRYIPKGEGQSVGPMVQPYGSETNLPGAGGGQTRGKPIPNPNDAPMPPTAGSIPFFPEKQNVDLAPVSKQVGQVQEYDIGRNKIADLFKRTGLDIKALTKPEWDELNVLAKSKPEELYSGAIDPVFKAKTKNDLPAAAEQLKTNLAGLTKFFPGKQADIKKGLGKAFAARLVEESGDGKFANPESLIFRMEQIGEPLVNEMFGSDKAFSSLKKLAQVAKSQKSATGVDDTHGAKNSFVAFTKVGLLIKAARNAQGKDIISLGKDKDKLLYLPWDKVIEKFATPKTVNLLSPGNQRFTRRAIDFNSDEASESGEPIMPRVIR